jgi:phosphoribosylamine--glycine ligase
VENDLLELLWAAAKGTLKGQVLRVSADHTLCVVIAAKGYPDSYGKGDVIEFPSQFPAGTDVIHAGTALDKDGRVVTAGGRVLGVTGRARTLREAADKAYSLCGDIRCASKYYRNDIGAKQLNRR